jgi:hypothetical protein
VDPKDMEEVREAVDKAVHRKLEEDLRKEQAIGVNRYKKWPKLPEQQHWPASELASSDWWVGKYKVRMIQGRAEYCAAKWVRGGKLVRLTHNRNCIGSA